MIDAYGFILYMVNGMSDTDLLPEGVPLIKVKYYSVIFLNGFWYLKKRLSCYSETDFFTF